MAGPGDDMMIDLGGSAYMAGRHRQRHLHDAVQGADLCRRCELLEKANEGYDTLISATEWVDLSTNIEALQYSGVKSARLNGNALSNDITGNVGQDRIEGRDGDDDLWA